MFVDISDVQNTVTRLAFHDCYIGREVFSDFVQSVGCEELHEVSGMGRSVVPVDVSFIVQLHTLQSCFPANDRYVGFYGDFGWTGN